MSDSDDDRPISALISKRLPNFKPRAPADKDDADAATRPGKKVKVEPTSTSSKVKAEKASAKSDEKPKRASSSSSGAAANRSVAFYEETEKGLLVQRLLVRWWYAIEWPKAEEIGSPPEGYESLEGFQGVFISTKSDSLGTIVDLRNKANCPNLVNLSAWSSAKLKETLVTAYEEQMRQLTAAEGDDCALYRSLKAELKEVKRVDADKADREARKFSFGK